jgi:hypothetical protein
MGDLISKKEVINLLCNLHIDNIAVNDKRVTEYIEELPPAYSVIGVVCQIHNRFEGYLDEIIDNPEKLDKVDFLLKQNNEICNLVRNGGKE